MVLLFDERIFEMTAQQPEALRRLHAENITLQSSTAPAAAAVAGLSDLQAQATPQQEPSCTAVKLAEMALSDCGHSSNNTGLLDRVSRRIDAHVDGLLDELRICLESKPAPQPAPAAQGDAEDAARYRCIRRGQHWSVIDGTGNELRAEALDTAIDAARSQAKEGGA